MPEVLNQQTADKIIEIYMSHLYYAMNAME